MIPGYLFLRGAFDKAMWETTNRIKYTAHVVLNFSGDVFTLKEGDVDVIRAIERGMNTPVPGKSLHNFKTGDKVGFIDDNTQRWPPGRIGGSSNDGRITVEIEVMRRLIPFVVFPHQIKRVGK